MTAKQSSLVQESFEDQLSRVQQMASGSPTWDLSPNDIAALKAVLVNFNRRADEITRLGELVERAVRGLKFLGEFHYRPGDEPHSLDCTLAGRVSRIFCIGMTRACELCRMFGQDPEWNERPKCRGCNGHGTPAGEAAGLICGACMGTGIECNVCED